MKLVDKIGISVLVPLTLVMLYFMARPLFKSRDDLTSVNGIIFSQQHVKTYGARSSINRYVVMLNGSDAAFAIQDTKDRAFKYLSGHNVIGMQATILYDANEHDSQTNTPFGVYEMSVNGDKIWTINETRWISVWMVLYVLLLVALVVSAAVWAKRRRLRRESEAS